jgi:NTP pyrophosphatase (non-canonical NTP hydrolase)
MTILAEEFGEAAMEANRYTFGPIEKREGYNRTLRDELIQTAAVAVAFAQALETGTA